MQSGHTLNKRFIQIALTLGSILFKMSIIYSFLEELIGKLTEEPRLKRSLTVFPLVVIGLAYMDPLVVFDSYGIVAQLTKGHVAAAYIFTLLALLLTALSYGNMVKAFPKQDLLIHMRKKYSSSCRLPCGLDTLTGLFISAYGEFCDRKCLFNRSLS